MRPGEIPIELIKYASDIGLECNHSKNQEIFNKYLEGYDPLKLRYIKSEIRIIVTTIGDLR